MSRRLRTTWAVRAKAAPASAITVAVAVTIVGVLHSVSGALLHELSSIPVIANSARLIGLRERD